MNDTATPANAYSAARAAYEAADRAANAVIDDDAAWGAAILVALEAYDTMLTARDAYWAAAAAPAAPPVVVAPRTIDTAAAAPAAPPVVVAPRTIDTAAVATLRQYALDNYEAGGHWAYETHEDADFQEYLDEANGNMKAAKRSLRAYWELITSVGNDIANS